MNYESQKHLGYLGENFEESCPLLHILYLGQERIRTHQKSQSLIDFYFLGKLGFKYRKVRLETNITL